jgi:hypothetical protein
MCSIDDFIVEDSSSTGFTYINGKLYDHAGFFASPEFIDSWLGGSGYPANVAS